MKRLPFLLRHTVFLLAGLSLWSCSGKKQKTTDSRAIFRYNEYANITSLDPAFASNQANIWAVNQLFNGLVQMNNKLQVEPCIARSWNISKDGTAYIFNLRQDVYFHDDPLFEGGKGRKVVAQDFVYSFMRIMDRKFTSPGSWIFGHVKMSVTDNFVGFQAPDDSTLIIYLEKPFPPFLGLLTMQYCSVIPIEIVDHYGKDFRNHPVGTGPFKFKMWKEGIRLILVKNGNYFERDSGGRGVALLDAVSVSFINDKQSAFLEFVRGNLDFLSGIDASYKDELLTRQGELQAAYYGKFKLETIPYLNTEYLGILVDPYMDIVKTSPLRIKEIRQAINYGFDRRKMITFLRNNMGTPGISGMVPPGLPSFDSTAVKGYDYNPEKARELLAKAGFPNGEGLPVIEISTTHSYQDLCEYIQSQLGELGIKTRLIISQAAAHREMVSRCRLNFFRASWIADYPDAENYLALFYGKNFTPVGPNYTHFRNKEFDKLYERAISEKNDSVRFELYRKMDRIIVEEAPVVVLYYDRVVRCYQNNVEGLEGNAMNLLTLKTVKKQKAG